MLIKKDKINKAFRELRKKGYIAKQNFMCCQSCGWAELDSMYNGDESKLNKVVFYHKQDRDNFMETGRLYLCWSGDGKEIAQVFESCDLTIEWDGLESSRIEVR